MTRNNGKGYGKPDAQGGTASLDFSAAPRAAQAIRLRRLGYTYARIADQCGYANESGARKAVKTASQRIIRDEAREYVGWQLDMLDEALAVVNRRIQADDKESLWAVDRLTPLLKRQAELLGLDAKEAQATQESIIREYQTGIVEGV